MQKDVPNYKSRFSVSRGPDVYKVKVFTDELSRSAVVGLGSCDHLTVHNAAGQPASKETQDPAINKHVSTIEVV